MAATTRDIRLLVRAEVEDALVKIRKLEEETAKASQKGKSLKDSYNYVKGAIDQAKKAVSGFVAALALAKVAKFTQETAMLYGQSEDLRRSLKNLATREGTDFERLMVDLKKATGGTVDEINLMKQATHGKFLGIDLKAMPTLLEFARLRAKETGQDINYMVESLIQGIGRKSPMILDNLGLKMSDLREETKKLAQESGNWSGKMDTATEELYLQEAALRVARKGIEQAGTFVENTTDKMAKNAAAWNDIKIRLGEITASGVNAFLGATGKVLGVVAERLDQTDTKLREAGFSITGMTSRLIELNKIQSRTKEEDFERSKIIETLNTKYSDYIGYIVTEKTENDKLAQTIADVNDQIRTKIALRAAETLGQKEFDKAANAQIKYNQALEKRGNLQAKLAEFNTAALNSDLETFNRIKKEITGGLFAPDAEIGLVTQVVKQDLQDLISDQEKAVVKQKENLDKATEDYIKYAEQITELSSKLSQNKTSTGKTTKIIPPIDDKTDREKRLKAEEATQRILLERAVLNAKTEFAKKIVLLDQWKEAKRKEGVDSQVLEDEYTLRRKALAQEVADHNIAVMAKQFEIAESILVAGYEREAQINEQRKNQYKVIADFMVNLLSGPMSNFINDWVSGTKKAEQAWGDMLKQIQAQLIDFLVSQAVKAFFSLLLKTIGGGAPGIGPMIDSGVGVATEAASGLALAAPSGMTSLGKAAMPTLAPVASAASVAYNNQKYDNSNLISTNNFSFSGPVYGKDDLLRVLAEAKLREDARLGSTLNKRALN